MFAAADVERDCAGIVRKTNVRQNQFAMLAGDLQSLALQTVDGDPDGVLSIGTDVTDQLRIQGELEQTRQDLDRVNRANVLGEFVSAIAHELNQPLAAVLANAQVARRYLTAAPPRVADTREMLDLIIRDDKRPLLADLRESGSIEQDADVVMFIYREDYYLSRKEPRAGTPEHFEWQEEMERHTGITDVIIGKQRHGPTGTVQLSFDANLTRFGNLITEDYLPERFE